MKYASICSGIEAASVAWHPLGWTPVLFSEIEPFPCAVLAERFPGVPNLGDMTAYRNWPEELLAEVDVLVGGTPCQAFSVAGKRQSLGDERGNLTLVFVNILRRINEVRRKHGRANALVVWENVPGVLNTRDNAFGCFLGALLGLDEAPETEAGRWPAAGFLAGEAARVGWRVLDAQYFGVAQRRRRVFLVASTGEPVGGAGAGPCPSEVLALRESRPGDPPPSRETRQASAGTSGQGAASDCWRDGGGQAVAFRWQNDREGLVNDGTAPSMRASSGSSGFHEMNHPVVVRQPAAQGVDLYNQQLTGDIHCPLRTAGGHGAPAVAQPMAVVAFKSNGAKARSDAIHEEISPTLNSDAGGNTTPRIAAAMVVRRLTPVECERLQGFPDDWTLIGYRGKPASECPDGPRYKAIGNSMAVPCMAWIGRQINKATGGKHG